MVAALQKSPWFKALDKDHLETVVSFASDLPLLSAWGTGYQLGPGTIRVAHTAEERIEMMWPLALEAWSLSGRLVPDYERKDAPVHRFIRPPSKNSS